MNFTNIPKEVLVAIVAACAALIVAIINLWSNRRTAKEQRRTQIELEKVKSERSAEEDRRQKRANSFKEKIGFLATDIQLIQENRENLRRFIDAPPNVTRLDESRYAVKESISKLKEQYARHYSLGNEEYLGLVHEAKGILTEIEGALALVGNDVIFTSNIPEHTKSALASARTQLQAIQERLKTEHLKLFEQYVAF